jgi:nucleotide-binding universal stress UspA family protein
MFKKAVVGVDLSPAEGPMMECLPDLKRWGIEDIVLVHVIKVGYAEGAGFGHEDEYTAWLNEKAASLREAGVRVSVSVRDSGVVAEELLNAAAEEAAGLVVVGSRSHNLVHRIFLGSVAKGVLRKASVPVLLERIEPTADETAKNCEAVCKEKLTTLLLATDFSENARRAEEISLQLLPLADTACFLSIIEPVNAKVDSTQRSDETRAKLAALRERTGPLAKRIELLAETGDPVKAISRVGEEIGATLIILGKHGRGWLPESVIGSTAESVCGQASRPVLMVPLA